MSRATMEKKKALFAFFIFFFTTFSVLTNRFASLPEKGTQTDVVLFALSEA